VKSAGRLIGSLFFGIIFSLIMPDPAAGKTILVPQDYPSIQEALDASARDDTIEVAEGIYYENIVLSEERKLLGKNNQTTIITDDGEGAPGAVVAINGDCTFSGFTVTGARGAGLGHAVMVTKGKPQITNNIIRDNSFTGLGIHSEMELAAAYVVGNKIYGNGGAGIANFGQSSRSIIKKNELHNNANVGIVSVNFAFPIIESNFIHENGAGIGMKDGGKAIIYKNSIINNKLVGINVSKNSRAKILNNEFMGNGTVGVNVDFKGQIEMIGNKITDNGAEAVAIKGKSKAVLDSNQIVGVLPTVVQSMDSTVRITRNTIYAKESPQQRGAVTLKNAVCFLGGNEINGTVDADEKSKIIELSSEQLVYTPASEPFWTLPEGLKVAPYDFSSELMQAPESEDNSDLIQLTKLPPVSVPPPEHAAGIPPAVMHFPPPEDMSVPTATPPPAPPKSSGCLWGIF